jgi:predicted HTH domain antitoxin
MYTFIAYCIQEGGIMSEVITARVDDETARRIGFFARIEKLERSAEVRRLLSKALEEAELEYALEKYRKGEITLGKAGKIAGRSVREMMSIAAKREIPFQYSLKELREDFEAAKA